MIRTNVGYFNTIATEVSVDSARIKNIKVHFSDDVQHVPVLMTAKVSDGEIEG